MALIAAVCEYVYLYIPVKITYCRHCLQLPQGCVDDLCKNVGETGLENMVTWWCVTNEVITVPPTYCFLLSAPGMSFWYQIVPTLQELFGQFEYYK